MWISKSAVPIYAKETKKNPLNILIYWPTGLHSFSSQVTFLNIQYLNQRCNTEERTGKLWTEYSDTDTFTNDFPHLFPIFRRFKGLLLSKDFEKFLNYYLEKQRKE